MSEGFEDVMAAASAAQVAAAQAISIAEAALAECSRLSGISSQVRQLDAWRTQTEDDYAEQEDSVFPGMSSIGGQWSGIVWYLGSIKYDFGRFGYDPGGISSIDGIYLGGEYLRIKLEDGTYEWFDEADVPGGIAAITDADEYNYYRVADIVGQDESNQNIYELSSRTCGDIRVDFAPFHAPAEEGS